MADALQTYYELLKEAHNASEQVDNFDLISENPIKKYEFEQLEQKQNIAQFVLIKHIRDNLEELYTFFVS